jgi:hypothetical protein
VRRCDQIQHPGTPPTFLSTRYDLEKRHFLRGSPCKPSFPAPPLLLPCTKCSVRAFPCTPSLPAHAPWLALRRPCLAAAWHGTPQGDTDFIWFLAFSSLLFSSARDDISRRRGVDRRTRGGRVGRRGGRGHLLDRSAARLARQEERRAAEQQSAGRDADCKPQAACREAVSAARRGRPLSCPRA